jgi:hypothetical protein
MHNRVVLDTACLLAAGSSAAVADPHVRLVLDRQHAGLCARDSKQEAGERAIQNRDDSGSSTKLNFLPGRPPVSDYKIPEAKGSCGGGTGTTCTNNSRLALRVCVLDRQSSLLTCLIYYTTAQRAVLERHISSRQRMSTKQTNTSHPHKTSCRKALHENNTVSCLSS